MAYRRTSIDLFELSNNAYLNATVAFYTVDQETGQRTTLLAPLYEATTGTSLLPNPHTLDSSGKFSAPVYIDVPVIGVVNEGIVSNHATGIIYPASGTFRGDWASGTVYLPADMIRDGAAGSDTKNIYVATVEQTAGVWLTDLGAGRWEIAINVEDVEAAKDAAALSEIAAADSADDAAASESAAAASAISAAASAAAAASVAVNSLNTTSSTSNSIAASGTKTFVLDDDQPWTTTMWAKFTENGVPGNYMWGPVTAFDPNSETISIDVQDSDGSGTIADWIVIATGPQGIKGDVDFSIADAGDADMADYIAFGDVSDSNATKKTPLRDITIRMRMMNNMSIV